MRHSWSVPVLLALGPLGLAVTSRSGSLRGRRSVSLRLHREARMAGDEWARAKTCLANQRRVAMDGILSALLVIVRTPHIRQYLEQTEPKALEQALEAIEDLEADQQSRNSLVQECLGLDLQPLGDANQVKDGEVADASLDPRDGDAGDAARLGEVGLGEARLHGSMRQGSRLATRARFSGTRTWERPAGI